MWVVPTHFEFTECTARRERTAPALSPIHSRAKARGREPADSGKRGRKEGRKRGESPSPSPAGQSIRNCLQLTQRSSLRSNESPVFFPFTAAATPPPLTGLEMAGEGDVDDGAVVGEVGIDVITLSRRSPLPPSLSPLPRFSSHLQPLLVALA